MSIISEILANTSHRPYGLPKGSWQYFQEWNEALFLHWEVPYAELRPLVPELFQLDRQDGAYYVSLVAFNMRNLRPRYLPAFRMISNFYEINLRTYINNEGRPGVCFLSIEASKYLSAFLAKRLSGLPYEKAQMTRKGNKLNSANPARNFSINCDLDVQQSLQAKTQLDKWLTERYCLYLEKNGRGYRYDIHHKEWPLSGVSFNQLEVKYRIGDKLLTRTPDLAHYSPGVGVISWKKSALKEDNNKGR